MNCSLIKDRPAPRLLAVILTLSAVAAQAQNFTLELRGVLTSPGCTLHTLSAAQIRQKSLTAQACGLTSGAGNPMSQMQIAHIGEETLSPLNGANISRKMVTLTYR